jgi:hypothetical protein
VVTAAVTERAPFLEVAAEVGVQVTPTAAVVVVVVKRRPMFTMAPVMTMPATKVAAGAAAVNQAWVLKEKWAWGGGGGRGLTIVLRWLLR